MRGARYFGPRAFTFRLIVHGLPLTIAITETAREFISWKHNSVRLSRPHFSTRAHTFAALRETTNWNEISLSSRQWIGIYLGQNMHCVVPCLYSDKHRNIRAHKTTFELCHYSVSFIKWWYRNARICFRRPDVNRKSNQLKARKHCNASNMLVNQRLLAWLIIRSNSCKYLRGKSVRFFWREDSFVITYISL